MSFQNALKSLVCAAAMLTATEALAVDRHVRIVNQTGVTLYRFYSTNSGHPKWGSDVMGSSTLPSGSSMKLNFDNANGYCEFDFRAIFEDGDEVVENNVNVCEVGTFTFN